MLLKLVAPIICLLQIAQTEDDKKWVWKKSDRTNERGGNSRYAVIEDGPFRPGPLDFDRPDRPLGLHQELGFPNRPFPNGPGTGVFVTNERPGGSLDYFPQGGHRPDLDQGILTGPVPSWVKEPPFKHYDKCKCAEKFNCNSPGISYGQCDVGKQYCCYNSNKDGVLGGPLPSRPIHSPENGILVGPGGPVDFPARPHRPHGSHNGILVGPGGPTGIIGRPPIGPFEGLGFGDYPQQNGPFRPEFGAYGRRNVPKKAKDDIK